MSRTVGMVPVTRRTKPRPRPACTACRAPLVDGLGIINGHLRDDVLICQPCGRIGVQCTCREGLA